MSNCCLLLIIRSKSYYSNGRKVHSKSKRTNEQLNREKKKCFKSSSIDNIMILSIFSLILNVQFSFYLDLNFMIFSLMNIPWQSSVLSSFTITYVDWVKVTSQQKKLIINIRWLIMIMIMIKGSEIILSADIVIIIIIMNS